MNEKMDVVKSNHNKNVHLGGIHIEMTTNKEIHGLKNSMCADHEMMINKN